MVLRLISAFLFIPFLAYSIFSKNNLSFSLLIAGIIIIGLIEVILLCKRSGAKPLSILCFILATPLIIIAYIKPSWYHLSSGCLLIPFWLLFVYGLLSQNEFFKRFGSTLAIVIYVSYLLSHLILIKQLPNSSSIIFFLFMVVWLTDTGAYIFGTRFGKHKLIPKISPNKSVEGAIAGCISGIMAGLLANVILGYMGLYKIPVVQAMLLGFILSIISQISDLVESAIKRAAGAKDSGNWIPGHGGLLDVFDGIIFTAPLLYWWIMWQ
ncbi:MAG: phosphatidate cytidylyltransferase [Candidatus Desantisbacteria bacterium]